CAPVNSVRSVALHQVLFRRFGQDAAPPRSRYGWAQREPYACADPPSRKFDPVPRAREFYCCFWLDSWGEDQRPPTHVCVSADDGGPTFTRCRSQWATRRSRGRCATRTSHRATCARRCKGFVGSVVLATHGPRAASPVRNRFATIGSCRWAVRSP